MYAPITKQITNSATWMGTVGKTRMYLTKKSIA